ncbi:restriction endonuclease subunit S [Acinetobacter towneri]|uniref:restriction endonuclease subunit S n=1 Tax=Acinetobacter towneri TaxID=202956 RepID=UPI001AA07905|nr:restriction endonuclease subunit S [Acinetobacter towneri]QTD65207.1 restriction endonuclease subunit S [Acinetobacter towneri]
MTKYQRYAEYKDSGVGFLGKIPEHWIVSRVKYLAPFQVGWTPPTKNDSNFIGDNHWVNISDLKGKVINNTVKQISDKAVLEASMDITPKGSLMYSFKLSVGAVSFAGCDMYTNEAIASFLVSAKLPLPYLYYALPKFVIENASTNIYGANILNQELIKNAVLIDMPFIEAEKIASFLDHETAKIDSLIEKQQKLIELLKEKRQAVISHAVTKGLNPDVPMKDSGVEWLGQVPEHWVVCRLKQILLEPLMYGANEAAEQDDINQPRYIRITDMNEDGTLDPSTFRSLPASIAQPYLLQDGDILLARSGATVGKSFYFRESLGQSCFAGYLIKARVNKRNFNPKLVYWNFHTVAFWHYVSGSQIQATIQNVSAEKYGNLYLALPIKKSEQIEITDFIDQELSKFNNLINKAQSAIQLMKERRTALISAAVTGKIDVRNWQAPNATEREMEVST